MKQVNTVTLYKNFPVTGYDNQVYYKSKDARKNAFLKHKYKTLEDISMVNLTTGTIRTKLSYYVGNMVNYALIETDEKDYYYFVDSVEWQSNGYCILHLSIDAWQTYVYDLTFHDSFVEREHVSDDTFGKHIVDEGLPVFGVKANKSYWYRPETSWVGVAIADTSGFTDGETGEQIPATIKTNNHYSTAIILTYNENSNMLGKLIDALVDSNKIDSIVGVFGIPIYDKDNGGVTFQRLCKFKNEYYPYLKDNIEFAKVIKTITRPTTVNGYTPLNNKCFTEPYNYITLSNNSGSSKNLAFELQKNPTSSMQLSIRPEVGQGTNPYIYCTTYENELETIVPGIMNPEIGWITNTYSAYMSANANAINTERRLMDTDYLVGQMTSMYGSAKGMLGNALSGNMVGLATGVLDSGMNMLTNAYNYDSKVARFNAGLEDVKSKGNTLHGSYTVTASMDEGAWGFNAYLMQVSSECIKMVDDYFSMYGYKVATIKKPQWTSRPYWNFVKTSGCNVTGNVPCDMLRIIEQMFDNGTTIWHDVNYMYKYSTYKANNKPQ